jgi:hypothetical protein
MNLDDNLIFFYDGRNRCQCKFCNNHLTWCYSQDKEDLFYCYKCGAKLNNRLDGYIPFTEEEALQNISRKVIEIYNDKEVYFTVRDGMIVVDNFHHRYLEKFMRYYIFADTKEPCGKKEKEDAES